MASDSLTTTSLGARRASVSLTMIVRNEERQLADCLTGIAGLFDDLVIVDTGSTDNTLAVARMAADRQGRPARVVEFPWTDSFAEARNEALRHAAGEWIFTIDADERLDAANLGKLSKLLGELEGRNVVYMSRVYAVLPDGQVFPPLGYAKLFPNRPDLRWRGRVHEGLGLPSDVTTAWSDVVFWHIGYREPEALAAKSVRNVRLLELQVAETPDNELMWFHLARECFAIGEREKGLAALARLDLLSTEKARSLADEVRQRAGLAGGGPETVYLDTFAGRVVGGSINA